MNKLNVFSYGFLTWRHLPNWPSNFMQFFRNLKYVWQRAIKGYCDQDVWNLDSFYATLFENSLRELKNTTHSYPMGLSSVEEWKKILEEMAYLFHACQEDNEVYENKYWEKYFDCVKAKTTYTLLDNGSIESSRDLSNEEKELEDKWFEEEKRITNQRIADKDAAFVMLSYWFFNLWD